MFSYRLHTVDGDDVGEGPTRTGSGSVRSLFRRRPALPRPRRRPVWGGGRVAVRRAAPARGRIWPGCVAAAPGRSTNRLAVSNAIPRQARPWPVFISGRAAVRLVRPRRLDTDRLLLAGDMDARSVQRLVALADAL